MEGLARGHVGEEPMDRNQAAVSSSHTVLSFAFQVLEELLQCRRTKVFQLQSNHLPIAALGGEAGFQDDVPNAEPRLRLKATRSSGFSRDNPAGVTSDRKPARKSRTNPL